MHRVFAAIRAWHRPRQHHSLFARWWRDFVILLPTWPLMHLFFSGPWYEGIGSLVGYSFIYALGEYGYFHVYGGTEAKYPNPPKPPSESSCSSQEGPNLVLAPRRRSFQKARVSLTLDSAR